MKFNERVGTTFGTTILVIIAITVGMFVWTHERNQEPITTDISVQPLPKKISIIENNKNIAFESIDKWATYQDKKYRFEFKYPKDFELKIKDNTYSVNNVSELITNFTARKWSGAVIQENTPGTFWEKLSYTNWKYFVDNYQKISSGECDKKTITHVPGPTVAELPKICIIGKHDDYFKVTTEDYIIYFTRELEIRWQLGKNNSDLARQIASTFKMN